MDSPTGVNEKQSIVKEQDRWWPLEDKITADIFPFICFLFIVFESFYIIFRLLLTWKFHFTIEASPLFTSDSQWLVKHLSLVKIILIFEN